MKQTIQTDLLGVNVKIGDETGTANGPTPEDANQRGKIRNVYNKNGDPKYSIQVMSGKTYGKLIELYARHFRILGVHE